MGFSLSLVRRVQAERMIDQEARERVGADQVAEVVGVPELRGRHVPGRGVPRAAVGPQSSQDLQMPVLGSPGIGLLV